MGSCGSKSAVAVPAEATGGSQPTLLAAEQSTGKKHTSVPEQAAPAAQRMLLVSSNLPYHEVLIRACLDDVLVVPVQYEAWSLEDLTKAICVRAGKPSGQFASVGLLDHGSNGKFCLLRGLGEDGYVDLPSLRSSPSLQGFFKHLGAYVRPSKNPSGFRLDFTSCIDLLASSVAAGEEGQSLIHALEELSQVQWAASADARGFGEGIENGFDELVETEERGGLRSVHSDYFEEKALMRWRQHCDWKEELEGGTQRFGERVVKQVLYV